MTRRKTITVDKFKGIDRRRAIYSSEPRVLYVGNNVELTRGGTVRSAPISRVEAQVDSNSVGLYAVSGKLRCAVPAGNSLKSLAPYNFVYDEVSHLDAGAVSTARYSSLHGVSTWGADAIGRAFPYIVLQTSDGGFEHHYIRDGVYKTRISLPFPPGASLVKQSGKMFAANPTEGLVHFCSTAIGPTEWDYRAGSAGEDDAGFIDVTNYADGDPRIRGLSFFGNSQLTVFFEDAVQFWITDPDPAAFQFQRALSGPGTEFFGSVTPVISDMYYFAASGFHSTQAVTALGETAEGDIGAEIFDLTQSYTRSGYSVRALWSQFRSQYLCFFSKDGATKVFCYTLSPLGGVSGWTTWDLDYEVDYAVENEEKVYLRSGDTVYRLDDSEPNEALGVTWTLETPMFDAASPRRLKQWNAVDFNLDGTIDTLSYRSDPTDTTKIWVGARNIVGTTAPGGTIPISGLSHSVGLKMEGTKGFELFDFTLDFFDLSGVG